MMFLNSISFERLLWLVPVFLTIHNMEEAPFMESWYKRLPLKLPLAITKRQFMIAVIFITLAGFVVTYFGVEYLANRTGYLIVLGMQAMLLFNAFVPPYCHDNSFSHVQPGSRYRDVDYAPFFFLPVPPRVRRKHTWLDTVLDAAWHRPLCRGAHRLALSANRKSIRQQGSLTALQTIPSISRS